jgi:hypothetical protein
MNKIRVHNINISLYILPSKDKTLNRKYSETIIMDYNTFFTFSTIGGYIEMSQSNQYLFTDTLSNDILIHTDFSNQNILIGTDSNDTSTIRISEIEVSINRNLFIASNFAVGIRDYSERFVVGNGNVKFHDNLYVMKQMGIGTSNLTHMLTLSGPSNSVLGPHITAYYNESSNPVYQHYNNSRDDIQLNFDCYNDGTGQMLSTSSTGNFQITKKDGRLQLMSTCNASTGDNITSTLYPAITINSNSYIGIATRDPTHRITIRAEDSNMLGPHLAYYVNTDSNHPLFQQLNWKHDHIEQNFDSYYNPDTSNWISSSSNGNFSVQKKNGRFTIFSSCNNHPGSNVEWSPAFTINSNSYIGIGNSNPKHRLSIQGPSNDTLGPHVALYLHDSNNPVIQIHACNNDMASINFNCWWNDYNWISSQSNANFQIIKTDGKLIVQSAEYASTGDSIDSLWFPAFTVNSNNYIGIRNSNPKYPLDVVGHSIFRSNLTITGNIIPNSNMEYDLGTSNNRFKDLYLSGGSIDMERLILSKDLLSGGLNVFDGVTNRPTRVWAKEMLLGDPYSLVDSNVFLVTASSNGLQLTLVEELDVPLQDFSQLNKLYVTQTNIGIGLSNPEKWFHVIGDIEQNPSVGMNLNWYNNVLRMEMSDLQCKESKPITKWNTFSSSNEYAPTYFTRTGYNDGSFLRFREPETMVCETNLEVNTFTWSGLTLFALVRFSGSPTSNDAILTFDSGTSILKLKKDQADPTQLLFETNDISFISPAGTVKQNEWALYAIRFTEDPNPANCFIKMYKNGVEIASESLAFMDDMSFPIGTAFIGTGNVDINCIYLFDRALFDDELKNLTRMIMYTSRQTHKVRTNVMMYPPNDFRDDTSGWVTEDLSTQNNIFSYSKEIVNCYYGNGVYKIWTNDEDFTTNTNQCYLVFDPSQATYWSTFNMYTTNSQVEPAKLYFELGCPIILQTYMIGCQTIDPETAPSKWNLYGSTNAQTWILIDTQTAQDTWSAGEEKVFYNIISTEPYKFFRIDIFQNSSFTGKPISIGSFKFYGMEHMLYLDGNGLGIGTSLVKEKLHVEGNALVSRNMTIGSTMEDEVIMCKQIPPNPLLAPTTFLSGIKFANGLYEVNQSAYYQNDGTYIGHKAFDYNPVTFWMGEENAYDDQGLYVSNTYNTEMSGSTRFGDWLEIHVPEPICLRQLLIKVRSSDAEISGPSEFYIAGSTNGNNWTQIHKQEYVWMNGDIDSIFYVNYDVYTTYTYFRLVVTKIGSNPALTPSTLAIGEWVLYGDMLQVPSKDVGILTVKGDLQVSNEVVLTSKNVKSGIVFNADYKQLARHYDNMSLVHKWNSFYQVRMDLQPTFYTEGGYRNMPFLRFNGKYIRAANKNLNISTNKGFTFLCQFKLNGSTVSDVIFDMETDYGDFLRIYRDGFDHIVCRVHDASSVFDILASPLTYDENKWYTIAFRYDHTLNKLEFFENNRRRSEVSTTVQLTDVVVTHALIGDENTDMDLSCVYFWDKCVNDMDLFEVSDVMIQGTQSLHVEKSVRISSGIEGGLTVYGQSNTSTFTKFPPSSLDANHSICKNNSSGNGIYTVSSSDKHSSPYEPYNVFSESGLSYWKGGDNAYSGVSGLYVNNKGITYYDTNSYEGEWIQIHMPQDIVIKDYSIKPSVNYATSAPRAWRLFGSRNGIEWVLLHTVGNATWANNDAQPFLVTCDDEYNYYRFAVSTIYTDGSTPSTVEIEKIEIYGRSRESFSVQDDRVIVFDKLGINNANPSANLHVSGFSILSGLKIVAVGDSNYQLPSYTQDGGIGGGGESIWTANALGVYVESNVGVGMAPDTTRSLSVLGSVGLYNSAGVATIYSSNNNIGINNPNPSHTLQVNGTTQLAGNLLVNNSATIKGLRIRKTTGSLPNLSTAIPGIGMSNDNMGMTLKINDTTVNNYIRFNADNTELARFTGEGYFGIGTSSPSHLLELGADSAAKPSSATWTITSDERLKTNITSANIDRCYDIVKQLPLRRFTWNTNIVNDFNIKDKTKIGWIAQEVEKVFPKAVDVKDAYGFADCKTLNSDQLYAVVYGAVQKLQFVSEDLKTNNTLLSDRMNKIESKVNYMPHFSKQIELFGQQVEQLKEENKYLKEILMKVIKKVGAI